MKNYRTKLSQRVGYAIIAGMAGAFLIPQVVFAAPAGEHDFTAGVAVDRTTVNTTKITSTAANNVINWRDYSVNQGEIVQYDGGATTGPTAHNYLNIVTGANTSNINGTITGGNDVYIVNPNGVIFGKSAVVNVGNLYVSTQDGVSSAEKTAFETGGTSPLDNTAALQADVVNMGKITATTVEVHGAHIRFLNAADVTTDGTTLAPVTVHTAAASASATSAEGGYAHIGYRGTAPTNYTSGTTGVSPEYYTLISTASELAAINTDDTTRAGNYMLGNDIDFAGASHTPIGTTAAPFTGKLDGNFFQIKNFKAADQNRAGLFGEISNARVENLGVTEASITGGDPDSEFAGGIAGFASGSLLKNVYVKDSAITSKMADGITDGGGVVGGIVGSMTNTTIDSAYSKNRLGGNPGGIVGRTRAGSRISNSYNDSERLSAAGAKTYFIYIPAGSGTTTITNSYNVGLDFSLSKTRLIGGLNNVYELNPSTNRMRVVEPTTSPTASFVDAHTSANYSAWGSAINNDGAPGAKWRIYEGRTLPLLTAFMNGRVDSVGSIGANYSYRKFNQGDGSAVADAANVATSNNHADVTGLTYDSKVVKIVDGDGNIGGTSNVTYDKTLDTTKNKIYTYEDTGTSLNTTGNIRNAGTKAMLWSDQDGPNLRNVNITINKRKINVQDSNLVATRMYDGTRDVTAAFDRALRNGGLSAGGFTPEDLADGSVTITPSTNFKATLADKNVARDSGGNIINKEVSFTGSIAFGGTNQGNYDVGDFDFTAHPNIKGQAKITPAPLILDVKKKEAHKIYDGTDKVTEAGMDAATNVVIDETLTRTEGGNTVTADIKTDADTHAKDDVSMDTIPDPTYVDSAGNAQIHAGDNWIIRYKNVKLKGADAGNYELYYQLGTAQNKVADEKIDLTGNIYRRQIKVDNFKVYDKTTHDGADATKVYNGNADYNLDTSRVYLSSNQEGTSDTTGVVERDRGYITFALDGNKATFKKSDGTTDTKNVATADKIAYRVTAQADATHTDSTYGQHHLLSDYWVVTDRDTPLTDTTPFDAMGNGKITPKTITASVRKTIEKVYDALRAHTETGNDIIQLNGIESGDAVTNESTAEYASKDVVYAGGTPTTQNVAYTAKFSTVNADEAQNYTFAAQATPASNTPVTTSTTLTGLGTITPRAVTFNFKAADKIYDGTTTNTKIAVDSYSDGANGDVIRRDYGATGPTLPGSITSSYDTRHAGSRTVTYTGLGGSLGGNYTVADTQTGTGTITRRLIESAGFQVRKGGTAADATKVYNGTSIFRLDGDESLVAKTAASGSTTGVVDRDKDNIYFELAGDAHFLKGTTGSERTSHVSEAERVGYSVKANTRNDTESPLNNYYFGTSDTDRRNLENVNGTDPRDAVTAAGSITPASVRATTREIQKVYDGLDRHTDGNRNIVRGDTVVAFTGWVTPTDTRTNTSTAVYADKDVSRDMDGNVTTKSVTYTAQLTGQYADDYQIVNQSNAVISTVAGTGANKTLTANAGTVANAGTITPRKLTIGMADVSKTYDSNAANTDFTVSKITDSADSGFMSTLLTTDGITAAGMKTAWENLRNANNAASAYGRLSGSTFTEDPNASNGNNHDVQYTNMSQAFKNAFASSEKNYEVDHTVYGKGEITRFVIDNTNVSFTMQQATKTYDGNRTVKYNESADPSAVKNYINTATLNLGSTSMNIKGGFTAGTGTYDTTADVNGGAQQGVTYRLTYTGNDSNITIAPNTTFTATGNGVITPKKITATVKSSLHKIYDATTAIMGVAADQDGSVVTQGDHIITMEGLIAGATNESEAVFTSKDAGSGNRTVRYTAKIDAAHAGNYEIVNASGNAITAPFTTDNNTITRRHVALNFTPPPSKSYDGTPENSVIGAPSVSSADATVLARDRSAIVSGGTITGLTGIASQYGEGNTDATFRSDANAGDKSVRYHNTGAAMRAALGSDAQNYRFDDNTYGTGTITKAQINASDVAFEATPANKVYDGTTAVKKDGSGAESDVKKYITKAEATVNGKKIGLINDLDLDTSATGYASPNATNGGNVDVNYVFKLNTRNVEVAGGNAFTLTGKGTINRRLLTLSLVDKENINKDYDRTTGLLDTAARRYRAFTDDDARGNVTYAAGTTNANKLVRTANGAEVNDGAQMTITANYAVRNVARASDGRPAAQDISYNVRIAGTAGANYLLSDGTTTVNAEDGLATLAAKGTISPRRLQLNFENPPDRPYDTTAENHHIVLKSGDEVTALGTNVGTTMLADDGVVPSVFDLTKVTSSYDNANAGTNKTVTYYVAGDTLAAGLRNNYEMADRSYGTGTITRSIVGAGDFDFKIDDATKIYDGTKTVKYEGKADARGYFGRSTVTFNKGTAYERVMPLNPDDFTLTKAEYNSADVADANRVDYDITIHGNNFDFGGTNSIVKHESTGGTIKPLDLTTQLPQYLYKEYDAAQDFTTGNADLAAAQAREGLINGLVKRTDGNDEDYLDYAVQGHYHTANATIKDKAAADANAASLAAGNAITAGTKVDYELSFKAKDFSSDPIRAAEAAKRVQNYTIFGTNATSGEAKNRDADIYRRTLTLSVGAVDKVYDGTDRTRPLAQADIANLDGFVGTPFVFDDAAAGRISGTYDSADVNRDVDGNVINRTVTYTEEAFDEALKAIGGVAENYRVDKKTGVGKISPRKISHDELRAGLSFDATTKEYDGTRTVLPKNGDVKNYLTDAHVDVTVGSEQRRFDLDKNLITIQSAEYDSPNVRSENPNRVTYTLRYDNTRGNFELTGGTVLSKDDKGTITPRKIYAQVQGFNPTKTYNKSSTIIGEAYNGGSRALTEADLQNYVTYRHYVETDAGGHSYDDRVLADNDTGKLQTNMTATFEDETVAWKDGVWRNEAQGDEKNVKYTFSLSGDAAADNYEFVDENGQVLTQSMNGTTRSAQTTRADGRIDPYRIELRAKSRELRAGEALPSEFEGEPSGRDHMTPLGDRLSGTIRYVAPMAEPRWGDYPINGYYEPASENETVYKNYFFESVPGVLHVNFYAPDNGYYQALTQAHKMLPDEYAYENASLDRRSHFGRKPEAELSYAPPSINMVRDGIDISKTGIEITDENVFALVNEVFA